MRTSFFLLLSLFCLSANGDPKPPAGMMPVEPEVLLKALPEKVNGWVLKRSKGRRGLGEWIECSVRRDFQQMIVEKSDAAKNPAPGLVKLSIVDTGKFKDGDLQLFADFKPLKNVEDGFEYLYLDGHPSIIIRDNESVEAQLLIGDRFIVTIYMENVPEEKLKNWYEMVNLGMLQSIKDSPLISLPDQLTVIRIDELNPAKSSRTSASLGLPDIPESEVEDEDN